MTVVSQHRDEMTVVSQHEDEMTIVSQHRDKMTVVSQHHVTTPNELISPVSAPCWDGPGYQWRRLTANNCPLSLGCHGDVYRLRVATKPVSSLPVGAGVISAACHTQWHRPDCPPAGVHELDDVIIWGTWRLQLGNLVRSLFGELFVVISWTISDVILGHL